VAARRARRRRGILLDTAARELAASAESVARQLQLQREASFPFVLAGGILEAVPWLRDALARGGWPRWRRAATVRVLQGEPAHGAVRLALEDARGGVRLPAYAHRGGSRPPFARPGRLGGGARLAQECAPSRRWCWPRHRADDGRALRAADGLVRAGRLDLSQVTTFNLDEFWAAGSRSGSYRSVMDAQLFGAGRDLAGPSEFLDGMATTRA